MKKCFMYTAMSVLILSMAGCSSAAAEKTSEKAPETKSSAVSETEEAKQDAVKNIGSFHTVDIYGKEVTEAIFAEADLTVLNVWGTFCGPCIGEMPELGEWSRSMPENVQLVGLVIDVNHRDDEEQLEAARYIVEKADAGFTHIIAEENELPELMAEVTAVPTTYFVDSEGNFVGEPIIGAYVAGYKEFVEGYLNEK